MPTILTAKTNQDLITHQDLNTLHDAMVSVLGTGASGYGTNVLSTSSTDVMLIQAQMVGDLYDDIDRCRRHQTNISIATAIPRPQVGTVFSATYFNSLILAVDDAISQRYVAAPEQLTTYSTSSMVVTNNWSSPVANSVVIDWNSAIETGWHFNLGGYLTSSLIPVGPLVTPADADMVHVLGLANTAFNNFRYDRDQWLAGSTSTVVTVSTSTGIYTATVNYSMPAADQVNAVLTIYPPAGANLTVDLLTTTTVYYSWDAVVAPPLTSFELLKLLSISQSQTSVTLKAGGRSAPVPITLTNLGMEPITVSDIVVTSNGANAYFVASVNDTSLDYPEVVTFSYPFIVPPSSQVTGQLYYSEPVAATTEVGVFNNTLTVISDSDWGSLTANMSVTIDYPDYAFDLIPINYNRYFEFTDWQNEFDLTDAQRDLGAAIAYRYFYPNTDFGVVSGVRRYGVYRRPSATELVYWVNRVNSDMGGNIDLMGPDFWGYIDAISVSINRSRTSAKNFAPGWGYGRFYDRTVGDFEITTGGVREYEYLINDRFGQRVSYTSILTNYLFNSGVGIPIQGAYAISNGGNGPSVRFDPNMLPSTGTCVVDVVVASTAVDLHGNTVTVSNTATLSVEVTSIVDQHYCSWVSAQNRSNGVVGISYDRIKGQPCITIGVGMGGDGANTLVNGGGNYLSVNNLGLNADSGYGNGFPLYKITWPTWSNFMNAYAVWPVNPPNSPSLPLNVRISRSYYFTVPHNGDYAWEYAVDDQGSFYIDDQLQSNVSMNFRSSTTGSIFLLAGTHKVSFAVQNNAGSSGNPGGIAIAIVNRLNGQRVWATTDHIRATPPYAYWKEVYRIPMQDGVPAAYNCGDYLVKNSYPADGNTYGVYFGTPGTAAYGSMMSVIHDGFGNMSFKFNPANSFTVDSAAAYTISGLQYAKYYYSNRGERINNLEGVLAGNQTHEIIGLTRFGPLLSVVAVPEAGMYNEYVPNTEMIVDSGNDGGTGFDDNGFQGNPDNGGFNTESGLEGAPDVGSQNDGGDEGAGIDSGTDATSDTDDGGFGDTAGSGNDGGDEGAGTSDSSDGGDSGSGDSGDSGGGDSGSGDSGSGDSGSGDSGW